MKRIDTMIERALQCSSIKDLYDNSLNTPQLNTKQTGKWTIQFDAFLKDHSTCRHETRTILLNPSLSEDELLSYFVLELINSINFTPFYTDAKARQRKIGCEEHAKTDALTRHKSALLHHAIMVVAIKELQLDPSIDYYKHLKKADFELLWESELKLDYRAEESRRVWRQLTAIPAGEKRILEQSVNRI